MSEEKIELPDLHEHVLDEPMLNQLFVDIAGLTEVIEVQVKGGAVQMAAGASIELESAKDLLISGEARGVQIRYVHSGQEWWDTLMRTPQGIRLIRIEAPKV